MEESSESDNVDRPVFENGFFIDIGLRIEKVVKTANKVSQGLIMTCYTSSLLSLTILSFQLVSSLGLNDVHTDVNRVLVASTCLFSVLMYLIRLYILMKSGEILRNNIQRSMRVLEDIIIGQRLSSKLKEESCNNLFILRKRLEAYQLLYPIAP